MKMNWPYLVVGVLLTLGSLGAAHCDEILFTFVPPRDEVVDDALREFKFRKADFLGNEEHFWGKYRTSSDRLIGELLYLFPNGRSAITFWCDVCSERVIARGRYVLKKNGDIEFQWQKVNKEARPPKKLNALIGQIEEERGAGPDKYRIISGEKFILMNDTQLADARSRREPLEYFDQMIRLVDWQRIQRQFESSVEDWSRILPPPEPELPVRKETAKAKSK
ncbi:MAG: hypothetical protein JNN20_16580 [Betaproteobacteria bacterium]|nr:hypothetical protein [Betaproteobacteria bacterium]